MVCACQDRTHPPTVLAVAIWNKRQLCNLCFLSCSTILIAESIGIAKLTPSAAKAFMVLIPITSPSRFTSGPPELPCPQHNPPATPLVTPNMREGQKPIPQMTTDWQIVKTMSSSVPGWLQHLFECNQCQLLQAQFLSFYGPHSCSSTSIKESWTNFFFSTIGAK